MTEQLSLLQPGVIRIPRARRTDIPTAHEAANVLKAGEPELEAAIRRWVFGHGPHTAFQIADALAGGRWQHDTIRSAVSRTLVCVAKEPKDPNKPEGRKVAVYGVMVDNVELPA